MEQELSVKKESPRFFYGYIVVLSAYVVWIMSRGSFQTFGVFFKPIVNEFGWTRAKLSGARSMTSLVEGILAVVAGRLTDRFGPLKVVLIFGSFLGIANILMSRVSNVWQMYLVLGLLMGIGMSATGTPTMTAVAKWFVKRRGMMAGLVQAGSGTGGMILPPLFGWLIVTYGWRPSYLILGMMTLVFIIAAALCLKRDPRDIGQLPYGVSETGTRGVTNGKPGLAAVEFSLGKAIRTEQFWMIWGVLFSFGLCRSIVMVHIVVHATDLGFSLAVGANMLAIMSAVGIVSRVGMGRFADIIGNKPALVISYAVAVVSLLWILRANDIWELYLFSAAFGFSWGAMAVMRMPITAEVFGISALGTILGAVDFGTHAGSFVGPWLAGWLFDLNGSYAVAFLVTASAAVIGLLLTIALKPTRVAA